MFFLRLKNGDKIYYLLNNKEYTVGRKDTDILITNDSSISRKHAIIKVVNHIVSIVDLKAKYNTFLNNVKIDGEKNYTLNVGDEVKFGALHSMFTLNEIKVNVVCSGLSTTEKASLVENLKYLGGTLMSNWSADCTHLTVKEIVLTVKVLCAITNGQIIVTTNYWHDFVKCIKNNQDIPDIKYYKPKMSEASLNQNISITFNPARKTLLKNKVFIFPNQILKKKIEEMVSVAGGKSIALDVNPISKQELQSSAIEYIVVQDPNLTPSQKNLKYEELVEDLRSRGKRTIPSSEIALAIVKCSVQKDCNPNFDRTGNLLTLNVSPKINTKVIIPETQSQQFGEDNIKSEMVVPETMDALLSSANIDLNTIAASSSQASIKRELESPENSFSKRRKTLEELEYSEVFSIPPTAGHQPSIKQKSSSDNPFTLMTKSSSKGSTKQNNVQENTRPKSKTIPENINPFSDSMKKKRKAEDTLESPVEKISNIEESTKVINPFTVLSTKYRKREAKRQTNENENIFKKVKTNTSPISSTPNQSVSVFRPNISNISNVTIINFEMRKKVPWLSKSSIIKKEHNDSINSDVGKVVNQDVKNYIDSLKDTIIIVETDDIIKKISRCSITENNAINNTTTNNKNFKKFRKVQPVHVQTHIIPKSEMEEYVCDGKNIPLVEEEVDSDDDMNLLARPISKKGTAKRKGLLFNF